MILPILFLSAVLLFQLIAHYNFTFLVQGNVGIYGQLINQGLRPYIDFYLHYPPAMPYLTAWLLHLSTNPLFPYHVIWIASSFITTLLIFFCSKKMFEDKSVSYLAASIFTLWHIFWAKNIFWFHTPIPIFATASLLCIVLIKDPTQARVKSLFYLLSGIFLGIATLFKQPAVFFFLTFVTTSTYIELKHKSRSATPFFLLVIGYLLPLIVIFALYLIQGNSDPFITHVISEGISTTNANTYGTVTFVTTGPPSNLVQFALYVLLIPYFIKIKDRLSAQQGTAHLLLLSGVLGGSFFLFPHVWVQYAQMALPFLSIITAYTIIKVKPFRLFALIFFLTLLPLVLNFPNHFRKQRISDVSNRPVVEWIKANTSPSEKIFVCCTEPEVYWQSQRLPASRYTEYNGPMLAAIDLNREITTDLDRSKPRIIIEFANTIWEKFNVVYLPNVVDYIHQNYTLKQEILPKVYIYELN